MLAAACAASRPVAPASPLLGKAVEVTAETLDGVEVQVHARRFGPNKLQHLSQSAFDIGVLRRGTGRTGEAQHIGQDMVEAPNFTADGQGFVVTTTSGVK